VVESAGHYAFLAPPPPGLPETAAEQRSNPPGFDRRQYLDMVFHPGLLALLRRILGKTCDV